MEPVSTMLLVASFLASPAITKLPRWDAPKEERSPYLSPTALPKYLENYSRLSSTQQLVAPNIGLASLLTLKDEMYAELNMYRPSGSTSSIASTDDNVDGAIKFIEALPVGIPLPTLMRSDECEIGFFWDNEVAYVDINIEADGKMSLFSRIRSSDKETFIEDIKIEEIDFIWAYKNLPVLSSSNYVLAA